MMGKFAATVLHRRIRIALTFVFLSTVAAAAIRHPAMNEKRGGSRHERKDARPNIIFVLTDDHRFDALGAAGNKIIQTPNLDKLASKGTLYKNAYVTTSICCVSRASILSGQYESRHKINNFKTDFTETALAQTYPILLRKAGYKVGFVGKYGVGTKAQPISYFDYWSCATKEQPDYILTSKDGRIVHNTDSVSSDIDKALTSFSGKGPFCLSVGFKAPHEQDGDPPRFIIQDRYKDLYSNITIPQPLTADPKYWNSFPDFFRADENIARVRWKPLFSTPEAYQATVKNYYRLITGVDEAIGKMVAKLKSLGMDKNTVIIFMGDNGFYLGEHGLEGKWYGHEESIRVPMIVYDPRKPEPQKPAPSSKIALNIDVAPTILAFAGVPKPETMQGSNLLDQTSRNAFFYEHTYSKSPKIPQTEGVVTADFKYMLFIEHNYEELYNVKTDPYETQNLASDPAYKTKLAEMRKRYKEMKLAAQ